MSEKRHYKTVQASDQQHLDRVVARWETVEQEVQARVANIDSRDSVKAAARHLQQAHIAAKSEAKIMWMIKAIDALSGEAAKHSACRKGCNHCCHIAVSMSEQEAEFISKKAKRPLNKKAGVLLATADEVRGMTKGDTSRFFGMPCPFLKDGQCSIYEHRPFACRSLVNMDKDDLLCQLVEGNEIKVPYLNTTQLQLEYADMFCRDRKVADIREWFPG